jgi:exopolysaccharide production protein ExoQ
MATLSMTYSSADATAQSGWLCIVLLAAAMVLGGGGSPAPLPELILQLLAAIAFTAWLIAGPAWRQVPQQAWWIAGLVAIIPLVQLIPLPPGLWQAMPGRELEREALALIGAENGWRPWSLAPDRTLASLLAVGPPLAVLVMTAALNRAGRTALLGVICAAALLTLLVGALQLSGGPGSALRLYGPSDSVLLGFQANRNSTADLMLIALVAVPALVVELARRDSFPMSRGFVVGTSLAGMALGTLGVVLTASRTGIVLLPLALIAGAAVLRTWLGVSSRRLAATALAVILAAVMAVWLLWDSAVLTRLTGRMIFSGELRPELWRDSLYAASQHFPWGVGMGDFVPAILAGERLEVVRETMPNRAHNDYLELAVEAGAFGIAALGMIATTLAVAARKALRRAATGSAALPIFAIAALSLLALHSLVDYPLRSMALACLAAACGGLLLRPRSRPGPATPSNEASVPA